MENTASRLLWPLDPISVVLLTVLAEGGMGGARGAGGLGGMEAAVKPMPSHITLLTVTHRGARGWLVLSEKEKSSAVGSAGRDVGQKVCVEPGGTHHWPGLAV